MRNLSHLSISRRALALLAVLSGLGIAVVIHFGTQRSAAQTAALAALRSSPATLAELHLLATQRAADAATGTSPPVVTVVQTPAPRATGATSGDSAPSTAAAPSGSAGLESTPAPATSVTTSASAPATTTGASSTTTPTDAGLPKVGHVFVLELSDSGYGQAFGSSSRATYLRSLIGQGTLLRNYRSLGHGELADELASISGQPPNADTTGGCAKYTAFPLSATPDHAGVLGGTGCVYTDSVVSLADTVTAAGKRWGAYVPGLAASTCAAPQVESAINSPLAGVAADYDPVHNPFIFFESLLEAGGCAADDQDISKLPTALATATATPAYTYIAADSCADGTLSPVGASLTTTGTTTTGTGTGTSGATTTGADATATGTSTSRAAATPTGTSTTPSGTSTTPTAPTRTGVCGTGAVAGVPAEDAFLSQWVPQILASAAYRQNGVLIIAFNGTTPAHGESPFSTGALILSHWTQAGRVIGTRYSPYSLLASVADMLDLQPLARAADAPAFAAAVL